jgi:hypothetical protein
MASLPPDDLPPARGLAPQDNPSFAPRINWRFWGPVLAVLIGFPLLWRQRRHAEAERRRAQLLREHAALTASLAPSYRALRDDVTRWVTESVGAYPGDLRDPSFSWNTFTADRALYGRVRVSEVNDTATALRSLRHRYPDQFMSCLGVEATFAREVFDKGEFLLPAFEEAVRGTDDADRLHALREDLIYRLRRDTAMLVDASRRRYFVLAVDEGRVSVQGATRVMVFDLTARRGVLRARGRGDDMVFIPFQIVGTPRPSGPMPTPGLSQHDCSVANAVRVVAGVPPLGLQHAPTPTAAAAPGDGGAPVDAPRHD